MRDPVPLAGAFARLIRPRWPKRHLLAIIALMAFSWNTSSAQMLFVSGGGIVDANAEANSLEGGQDVDNPDRLNWSASGPPVDLLQSAGASSSVASATATSAQTVTFSATEITSTGSIGGSASAPEGFGFGEYSLQNTFSITFDIAETQPYSLTYTAANGGDEFANTTLRFFGNPIGGDPVNDSIQISQGSETISFSGELLPGRYTLDATLNDIGDTVFPDFSASSSGSYSITLNVGEEPPPPTPEICDNGIDDDGDGDIDGDDFDCFEPIGLQVSCMHEPVYPQDGDEVTITARAIDENADPVLADTLEIYVNNIATPFQSVTSSGGGVGALVATFTATDSQFSYGCRAEESFESAQSWRTEDPKLRSVDTGTPQNPDWAARAVLYNGPIDEKLDIVFFHDDDEYTGFDDPDFLDDVHYLVSEGMWTIPWFVENQWVFNIWIATADDANASPVPGPPPAGQNIPRCQRVAPSDITDESNTDYAFRDVGAIVHTSVCRDNAGAPRLFTVEVGDNRPQVVAHEMGHRPFGLADEYCRVRMGVTVCDGGHYENPPFPNMYEENSGCRDDAGERPYDADACRRLDDPDGESWFLGEPDYDPLTQASQVQDLMQSTGFREDPPGSGNLIESKKVGLTEIDRMNWLVEQCVAGEC